MMRSKKTWWTALYLAVGLILTAGTSATALADDIYIVRDNGRGYYAGELYRPHRGYWRERRFVRRHYAPSPRRYYRRGHRRGGAWVPALVGGIIGYHLND